jgi:multidrug efflux system membrane fusion protein
MSSRQRLASGVAIAAIAAALGLGITVLVRLDERPRTHAAYVLADTADLAPDVSGRILKLAAQDNQRVRKGEPLLQIDPEPFQLKVRQAQAQVAALQAQIDLTARQIAAQTSGANAAASQVGRAREQLALARNTRARLEPLLGKGYVTEQQIDEARTSERSAGIALEAALQQAAQARQGITDAQSLIAQEHSAEAAEALAERDLRNATLIAPFDGLIVGLQIAEGEFASAGHPLFTMIKTSTWYVVGDFRETELSHIHVGDPATAWIMSDDRRPLAGRVESLGWGVRPEDSGVPGLPAVPRSLSWVIVAQRFPVRVRLIDPPADLMRIGATATVAVHPQRHAN